MTGQSRRFGDDDLEGDTAEFGSVYFEHELMDTCCFESQAVEIERQNNDSLVPGAHSGRPARLKLSLHWFWKERLPVPIDEVETERVLLIGGLPRDMQGCGNGQVRMHYWKLRDDDRVPTTAGDVELAVHGFRVVREHERCELHLASWWTVMQMYDTL